LPPPLLGLKQRGRAPLPDLFIPLTCCFSAFCLLWLDDVGEAFAGAGEPPVAEEEEDDGEGGEV